VRRHTSDPVAHRPHHCAWHRGLAARPFTAPRVHKDCGERVRAGRTERAVNLLLTVHCSGALAVSGAAKDSPTLQSGDGRAGRAADGGRRGRDAAFGARRGAGGGRQAAAEPAGTSETLRAARARAAAAVAKTGPNRPSPRPAFLLSQCRG